MEVNDLVGGIVGGVAVSERRSTGQAVGSSLIGAVAALWGVSQPARGDLVFDSVRYDGSVRSGATSGVERHFTDTNYYLGGGDVFDVPLPAVGAFPLSPLLDPFDLLMDFVDLPNAPYQGELLGRTTVWITNQTISGNIFANTLDSNETHPVEFEAYLYDDELGPQETVIVYPIVENFAFPYLPPSISSITGRGSMNDPLHIQLQMTASELAFRNGFAKIHLYYDYYTPTYQTALYDDTVQPDLSNDYRAPTAVSLPIGASSIVVGSGVDDSGNVDLDFLRVNVPPGAAIQQMILAEYEGESATSFVGMQSGAAFTFNPDPITGDPFACISECLGWTHFGPGQPGASVGQDLLPIMSANSSSGFTAPLASPEYTFWMQENNSDAKFTLDFVVTGGAPTSPVIGSSGDLEEIARHTLPGGRRRAEQGVTWAGGGWVTAQGQNEILVGTERILSRFTGDWKQLVHERIEDQDTVEHIGDVTWSGQYVYAPIEVQNPANPEMPHQKIVRYDAVSLDKDENEEWDVPNNIRLAGVEYHDGKLYGVEFIRGEDADFASVLIFEESDLSATPEEVHVDVPWANGIAINNGLVFITSGCSKADALFCRPKAPEGRIHVFSLSDFAPGEHAGKATLNAERDGFGSYSYRVPHLLHAEGLAFLGDELWVALGDEVAQLDTTGIAQDGRKLIGTGGDWGPGVFPSLPNQSTSVVLEASTVSVSSAAKSRNLYLFGESDVVLGNQGSLEVGGSLAIREGRLSVGHGRLEVGELSIGSGNTGNGELIITDFAANIQVSRRLRLEENGAVSIVVGSTIQMTGSDFENFSTSSMGYGDLANLSLMFAGGSDVVDLFEVASEDIGGSEGRAAAEYRLGALQVGGANVSRVMLIDDFDNQLKSSIAEALYVDSLQVLPGSILYLNAINLYAGGTLVLPGQGDLYGGGVILSVIPEPPSLLIVCVGVLFLWCRRKESQTMVAD
jgi:hypothetical protein